jgi:pilus assembly protein CpaF
MNTALNEHLDQMLRDAFAPLKPLLDNPFIREIMVNAESDVWIEREGRLTPVQQSYSPHEARNAIHILASMAGRDVGSHGGHYLLDAAFSGMRISAVLPPIAVRGHALCIRKLSGVTKSLSDYLPEPPVIGPDAAGPESGLAARFHVPGPVLELLTHWVAQRRNILVSGGTSTGKTTFLNALIRVMSPADRLVVIEDTRELIVDLPNHVAFQANPALGVSLRDLVRQSLRFRPDRIVVGEVRGGEAFDLVQAMNTGHDGCLGTLHANSALDALSRLEQLVMQSGVEWGNEAIARQIAGCVDGVIHLSRRNGIRQIENMIRVEGYRDGEYRTQSLFQR